MLQIYSQIVFRRIKSLFVIHEYILGIYSLFGIKFAQLRVYRLFSDVHKVHENYSPSRDIRAKCTFIILNFN